MGTDRAYALLTVKSFDVERRSFSGIATSPDLDRHGHSVDPAGITFTNPIPLLLFHDQREPIGRVTLQPPTADGIAFDATIAEVVEPGPLRERLDLSWQSIKAGLLTGVSVGLRIFKDGIKTLKDGTVKISRAEIVELSLVTIPANMRASILTVKQLSAATGDPLLGDSSVRVVKATREKPMHTTTTEQITSFEATRASKAARMVEIMGKAGDDGSTLDAAATDEYDGLAADVKSIDAHITRLRDLERLQIATATPIKPVTKADESTALRGGTPIVSVRSNVEPGTAFVRAACAMLLCKGNFNEAAEYARARWESSTPEVSLYLKAAVAAGNTTDATWAGPLVQTSIAADFLSLLRPATILGKIPNLRQVPFNTKVPSQTAGGTYGWVGEAKPKPVTKLAFSSTTLGPSKVAGIIVLTEELVRLSSPSAEALARQDMIAGIAQFLDQQFIDPAVAAVAGVSPGSITNGAPTSVATANPLADLLSLISFFSTNNVPIAGLTLIMSEANALSLSFRTNSDGSAAFPGLTMQGGTWKGINVVTSNAAGGNIIALQPSLVLYADDGQVTIDASREASVQMDSAPMSPADATTVYVSLWQNNLVGLRAERFINWLRASANAVKYLTAAAYPAPSGLAGTGNGGTSPSGTEPKRHAA